MRSNIAKRILDETPGEVRRFVLDYGDNVIRKYEIRKAEAAARNQQGGVPGNGSSAELNSGSSQAG